MTIWIVVTVVSKSSTSWEIATFITAWSRTIRNCAGASTNSGTHFRIAAEPTGGSGSRRLGAGDRGFDPVQPLDDLVESAGEGVVVRILEDPPFGRLHERGGDRCGD